MFYVRVKPSKVKEVCTSAKKIWVVDAECSFYVEKSKRGSWNTRKEAEACITENWEDVVEEKSNEHTKHSQRVCTHSRKDA